MRITWLGWAGVQIEARGQHVVIDPLLDPLATFAWLGKPAGSFPIPQVVAPRRGAVAGLLTHLHRDHADAAALVGCLDAGAAVYEPADAGGSGTERLGIVQADQELNAAGLHRIHVPEWTSIAVGPFQVTALPAVDGTGDPQVSWLVKAENRTVLHLGDTMWHGWWWRFRDRYGAPDAVLAPIDAAELRFPHRRPHSSSPGVMGPEQAAHAAELLSAARVVPIHYDGYDITAVYRPTPKPLERLLAATDLATAMRVGDTAQI